MASEREEYMAGYGAALHDEHRENFYKNNNYLAVKEEYKEKLSEELKTYFHAELKEVATHTNSDKQSRLSGSASIQKKGDIFIGNTHVESKKIGGFEFKGIRVQVDSKDIKEVIEAIADEVASIFAEHVILKKNITRDTHFVNYFKKPQKVDQLGLF